MPRLNMAKTAFQRVIPSHGIHDYYINGLFLFFSSWRFRRYSDPTRWFSFYYFRKYSIFEPTCACCTVGSYAALSVCCLSGLYQNSDWIIIHISESIVGRSLKLHHSVKPLQGHLGKILITL